MNPRISIIVPSYNHSAYLQECLGSVREQTFDDWELILIDDLSQDDSVEIARDVAQQDRRIRVLVNETNRGTYATQALGVSEARADLIAILNSDDVWHPSKLERQVRLVGTVPDAGAVYCLGQLIDAGGSTESVDVHGDWPRDERQDLLPYLLEENRVLASGVLYRRDLLRFEPSLRYSGDWVALLHTARRASLACVAEPSCFWRQHGTNTSAQSSGQVSEEIAIRRAILAQPSVWASPRHSLVSLQPALGRCAFHLSALEVLQGSMPRARASAWKALRSMKDRPLALRRWVTTWLPPRTARRRLWPHATGEFPADSPSLTIDW